MNEKSRGTKEIFGVSMAILEEIPELQTTIMKALATQVDKVTLATQLAEATVLFSTAIAELGFNKEEAGALLERAWNKLEEEAEASE